ncbi:Condensin-2 complex subunit H2 [Chionoecetes opilio]|uniref:Condensin-2 complex subunit H2 n=1 Tax=Chionoecetes opilio TaxID=41210 RepID=A0A8J5CP53_CHIOP|nr:Condensin-2 complex subunit H2 [Chionoecetes opilio]
MAARHSQSHPPLSQELDARFSVFLNPIRDLTKNWEVDIAKYLEEYLEELAGLRLSFDGGVTSMNFAEAAMLIQGSVTIYSKKVDFLWQMVLKTLDLLSSRRALESSAGGLEVGGGGGGGGRKNRTELNISFSCVDSIQVSHNIVLQEDDGDDHDQRRKSVKPSYETALYLSFQVLAFHTSQPDRKRSRKSQNRISLRVRNNEVLGAKDDFRLTRSFLTPEGVLHLEVPGEMLGAALALGLQFEAASGTSNIPEIQISPLPEQVDQPPSEENLPSSEDDPPTAAEDPPTAAEDPPTAAEDPPPEDDPLPPTEDHPPEDDPPSPGEHPPSEEDHPSPGEDPPPHTDISDPNHNNNNEVVGKQRYGLRKRNKDDREVLATLKLTDKLKPFDPNADCPPKRPPRAGRLRVPTPCPCHLQAESKKKKNQKNKSLSSKNCIPLEEFITRELKAVIIKKSKRDRGKKVPPEIIENAAEEEANRINEMKLKMVKCLSEQVSQEDAVQAAEEAGQEARVAPVLEEEENDHLADDAPVDLDLDSPEFDLPEAHHEQFPESAAARFNDSVVSEEPASEYEALVLKWVADYVNSAQESVKSSELERRVNVWRKTVTPKLQAEEARTEFDIHRYGSQILGHFPSDGRKQTIAFNQLMVGKDDPREVARYFLSSLMLANSHNIELSQSDPGDLAMDCLELTLKSRVRPHEELAEYAAPSQVDTARSSGMDTEHPRNRAPGVCADITQTTNLQSASNRTTKGGCGKKRALPR